MTEGEAFKAVRDAVEMPAEIHYLDALDLLASERGYGLLPIGRRGAVRVFLREVLRGERAEMQKIAECLKAGRASEAECLAMDFRKEYGGWISVPSLMERAREILEND